MTDAKQLDQGGPSSPFNRTAQHDAKRAAILSQAAKLFNYKGSRATTLRDIAESLGTTANYVSLLRRGHKKPSLGRIDTLSEILDCHPKQFFK